jgi:polysaccharide chain length determinant protein (PEP-CTERM system associated)
MSNDGQQSPFALDAALQRGKSQIEELVGVATSMLTGMWRYRWPALFVAWATCLIGWAVVYALPDEYEASTRIYIDAESMIERAVGDLTLTGDVMTEINILTRAMLSQPQLEKTARLADLDLDATTPEQHERLIADLGQRVTLAKEGGENIFRISFRDRDRRTAEVVVQTILDSFREDALGERRSDSAGAATFVEQQIQEYERRLNESDKRLADFKRTNIGLMPGETGDYYTRLQRAMQSLETTRAALRLANERRAEYQSQLVGEEPVFGIVAPSFGDDAQPIGGNDALIAQYESDLSTLLLKYTENHPDAVALRDTIARLKAQREEEFSRDPTAATRSATAGAGRLETNPVYQSMRMGLSETEVEIRTLRSQLATEEATVAELQRLIDTIPDIERQLTALNRDYDVTREQYEQLLKRRESLHITGEVEQTGDQLQFRTLEPPRAPVAPVGPDRPLFLVGTAVAGIGLALALAWLLQQLNPVFVTRRELRDVVGLPVLGTVSLVESHADRAAVRRGTLVFGGAALALPVALGLAVLVQDHAHRALAGLLAVLAS